MTYFFRAGKHSERQKDMPYYIKHDWIDKPQFVHLCSAVYVGFSAIADFSSVFNVLTIEMFFSLFEIFLS